MRGQVGPVGEVLSQQARAGGPPSVARPDFFFGSTRQMEEGLSERVERAKPVIEVLAYGVALGGVCSCWSAIAAANSSRRATPESRRWHASPRLRGSSASYMTSLHHEARRMARECGKGDGGDHGRGQSPADGDAPDACHGALSALATYSRLEADTPYRVSCMTGPVAPDACYRLGVRFTGQRSLLLFGNLFSGAPTTASAEATSVQLNRRGSSDERKPGSPPSARPHLCGARLARRLRRSRARASAATRVSATATTGAGGATVGQGARDPVRSGERRGSIDGQAHLDRMTRALGSRDKHVARRDAHTCMEGSAGIAPSIPARTTGMSGLVWRDKRTSMERHAGIDGSKCGLGSRDKRVAPMEVRGSMDRSPHLHGYKPARDGGTRGDRWIQVHGSIERSARVP